MREKLEGVSVRMPASPILPSLSHAHTDPPLSPHLQRSRNGEASPPYALPSSPTCPFPMAPLPTRRLGPHLHSQRAGDDEISQQEWNAHAHADAGAETHVRSCGETNRKGGGERSTMGS